MKTRLAFALLVLPLVPFRAQAQELTIAVAANAQFVAKDIVAAFTKQFPVKVSTVIGASGSFTTQILNGAPFDVFLSADTSYPDRVAAAGLALEAPRVYAYGALVLWSTQGVDLSAGLPAVASPAIRSLAIADPAVAPYGVQAVNALRAAGLLDQVRPKIVYGESIAQVNSDILTGAADAGITARSIVLSPEMRGKGAWVDVDRSLYQPIAQSCVVVKRPGRSPSDEQAARELFDFLFAAESRSLLASYGYLLPQ